MTSFALSLPGGDLPGLFSPWWSVCWAGFLLVALRVQPVGWGECLQRWFEVVLRVCPLQLLH